MNSLLSRSTATGAGVLLMLSLFASPLAPAIEAQGGGTVDASLYSGMRWRSIGPDRGGRSIAVAGTAARPNEYYFGATGGGVWKTTDYGHTWTAVGDQQFEVIVGWRDRHRTLESRHRVCGHGRVVLPRQHHPG